MKNNDSLNIFIADIDNYFSEFAQKNGWLRLAKSKYPEFGDLRIGLVDIITYLLPNGYFVEIYIYKDYKYVVQSFKSATFKSLKLKGYGQSEDTEKIKQKVRGIIDEIDTTMQSSNK